MVIKDLRMDNPIRICLPCIYLVVLGGTRIEQFVTQTRISNSTKMAAVLGMCLVFKTVISAYQRNDTHLKYSKWNKKALKNI